MAVVPRLVLVFSDDLVSVFEAVFFVVVAVFVEALLVVAGFFGAEVAVSFLVEEAVDADDLVEEAGFFASALLLVSAVLFAFAAVLSDEVVFLAEVFRTGSAASSSAPAAERTEGVPINSNRQQSGVSSRSILNSNMGRDNHLGTDFQAGRYRQSQSLCFSRKPVSTA